MPRRLFGLVIQLRPCQLQGSLLLRMVMLAPWMLFGKALNAQAMSTRTRRRLSSQAKLLERPVCLRVSIFCGHIMILMFPSVLALAPSFSLQLALCLYVNFHFFVSLSLTLPFIYLFSLSLALLLCLLLSLFSLHVYCNVHLSPSVTLLSRSVFLSLYPSLSLSRSQSLYIFALFSSLPFPSLLPFSSLSLPFLSLTFPYIPFPSLSFSLCLFLSPLFVSLSLSLPPSLHICFSFAFYLSLSRVGRFFYLCP